MSTLRDIYDNEYSPQARQINTPFSLRLKKRAFMDAVEEAMGAAFIEHHRKGLSEWESFQNYASFREGFRLGVSLMMELR